MMAPVRANLLGHEVEAVFCGWHTKNKTGTRVSEIHATAIRYLAFACERNTLHYYLHNYYFIKSLLLFASLLVKAKPNLH